MGVVSFETQYQLAAKALGVGATRLTEAHVEWDISGECEHPLRFETFARPAQRGFVDTSGRPVARSVGKALLKAGFTPHHLVDGFEWERGENHPLWVSLIVRCRRCEWCLRRRAILWANKARNEIASASRTWFATFTATPDQHFVWECAARMTQHEDDHPFEALSENEQFRRRCAAAGADITRYVKRVRKQSGAPLRYLFVAEKHQSGLPHWHALFHEVDPAKPIRKAVLKEQWPYGFTRFKLAENQGTAWYLCKYLSKDVATRVRSSLHYGQYREAGMQPVCIVGGNSNVKR